MFEYYSRSQGRFIKADDLDLIKSRIDNEKKIASGEWTLKPKYAKGGGIESKKSWLDGIEYLFNF